MRSFDDDALRRVLEAEAAAVEVRRDALPEIRRRIAARRAWWSPRGGFVITFGSAAVATATAVALFAGMGSCAPRDSVPPPIAGPSSSAPDSAEPTSPTPAGSSTTGRPPDTTALVRVYYLGNDRGRPRLYPEFHTLPVGDGSPAARTRAALTEMFDGLTAYDPDYSSGWPAGTRVRGVRIDGGAVVVDLTGFVNGSNPGQLDPDTVRQSVQQLIWTATAVTRLDVVRLLLDGKPVSSLWGIAPVAGDLRRAPAVDVVGLVWVIDPQQDAAMGRTFTVKIAGIVFEATAYVKIKRGTTVVHERFVTLDKGPPEQGEFSYQLTLAPGTYTIEGYSISPEDGSVAHLDNHQFTVR
jgi:hypothetical protein